MTTANPSSTPGTKIGVRYGQVPENTQRRLFVAMPYREREGLLDHEDPQSAAKIDFDAVWKGIIFPAIPEGFMCKRADELQESGLIDQLYNEWLLEADVVLADITFGNPNVFYELGIRQALSQRSTVLVAQARSRLPFDVRNQAVLNYDYFKAATVYEFHKALRAAINTAADGIGRSPVHIFLPDLYVGRFPRGEDPETVIRGLKTQVKELQEAVARSAADAELDRINRRLASAETPAQLVALYYQLLDLSTASAGVIEAAAIKLRKFGLLDQAITLLDRARERWPRDAGLLRELGFCHRKRGPAGFDQAQHYFEEALRINDGDPELHGMVGGMLKRMGKYDEALSHYNRANELLPRNLYALVNLGTIQSLLGKKVAAVAFYRQVLRYTDHPSPSSDYWDLLCRGEAAVFLGEVDIATRAYNEAVERRPPVEDIRSAAEQLALFVSKNIQVALAASAAAILERYLAVAPAAST
jgi:tetratricopeptide (TPR) repeat protein